MRALLTSLRNLAQRTGIFTVAEATEIYNALWRIIGLAALALVGAFVLNAKYGFQRPSLILAVAFAVVAVYIWAKPLHILFVAGVGLARKVASDATVATEVENTLMAYLGLLKWVLFGGMTFLLITGTIPFSENPVAMLRVLVALGVAGLCVWLWPKLFAGTWARKTVYWGSVVIILAAFGSLIPGTVWTKYTGWEPKKLAPSRTEKSLYRFDNLKREMADEAKARSVDAVIAKIGSGNELTASDEEAITNARRSVRAEPSVPARAAARAMIPLASLPREEWPRITLAPSEKSGNIEVPVGMHISVAGDNIALHTVYVDGRECVAPKETCPNGYVMRTFIANEAAKANIVAYAFAKN